ncbi:hypothetical protein NGB36_08915 [Streptomyces sp. RB6PN25]|uniref:Bacterial transcriptional activator domain-containing protein n=1 Tax=Streptomyces humicola TaxID=2953240 RepID=A0ABT1PW11_9ACTN|nr:BTAD domain-containing putative transcriptional regulator [Streptomyces humicola]MCQ4080720.1 hypothetical protein [Streptomyces humicola]
MARTTASGRPGHGPGHGPGQPIGPAGSAGARPRRTTGDFLRAAAAFLALVVLVVGVPGALVYFIGWPLPHSVPSLDTLKDPITSTTFVDVLAVVVWLAWAQFTACVLVEAKAAVSGVGVPSRIPGAGPSQLLARQLVAALLLVGATAASLTPGLSSLGGGLEHQGPARPGSVAAAQQLPGQQQHMRQRAPASPAADVQQHHTDHNVTGTTDIAADSAQAGQSTKFYRIQPPEGRHHDSLWEIAQRHLGDGRRYKEIFELNKDRVQPDGSRLSQASLIRPGWILEMPGDARGGDLVEASAPVPVPAPTPAPTPAPAPQHDVQHGTQQTPDAQEQQQAGTPQAGTPQTQTPQTQTSQGETSQGQTHEAQEQATQGAPAATTAAPDSGGAASHSVQDAGLPDALVAAPLLAAGLLAALGRRRRTALLQAAAAGLRMPSVRAPRPGAEADTQDALLVGADPRAVAFLDRALRSLSARLAALGRRLPTVYAAWLAEDALHLQLAWPDGEPPAPWRIGQDQTFWRLDRTALPVDAELSPVAPYPGLATLGTLDGSRLLLNLEAVPGLVTLSGGPADRETVLASLAAELATNGWSDRMTVTLVGFGEPLGALAPTRVRILPDLGELLEAMEDETTQRRGALGTAGHNSVLTGRAGQAQHTQWAPHLVLLAADPTPEQAERLAALAADSGLLGIGYLIATSRPELPGAAWQLEATPDGRLLAPLLGLDLEAQRLPQTQYEAVLRLFADAGGPDGAPEPGSTAPPFLVDLSDQGRPAVYARLMGPFEVMGVDALDADRSVLAHEALALLLLHRDGVHPRVLASALWPRGATDDVRDAVIERVGSWLGTDPDGTPRLRTGEDGRLSLSTSVVSDWDVLQTLRHDAEDGRGRRDAAARRRLLGDALALARGPLLADRPAGRYGWLAHEIVEAQLPLLVSEVAIALCDEHRATGNAEAAVNAIQAAMRVTPGDERLWVALLRAVHATGDEARLRSTAAELADRARTHHGPRGLPPRTRALLDELLPSWRAQTGA